MDISNRALAMFLLAAIVVSLAGTLSSINRIGSLTTTGFVATDTGTVQLNVAASASITLDTFNDINFGSCAPFGGVDTIITSEDTINTSNVCTSFTQDNHTVRNDGNVDVNVTINATKIGEANGGTGATLFLDSSGGTSSIAYKGIGHGRTSVSGKPGCLATDLTSAYTNFTTAGDRVIMCQNLTWGANNNSFTADYEIVVPNDVILGAATTTIEFYGQQI